MGGGDKKNSALAKGRYREKEKAVERKKNRWMWTAITEYAMINAKRYIVLLCLQLHTSLGCFCPRIFLENTEYYSLLSNLLLSCLHSQLRYQSTVVLLAL